MLSQCYSVWTPLQRVFYGLRLLSTTRVFRVDLRVVLIGVILEEGSVTSSWAGKANGIEPRGGGPAVNRP